MLPAETNAQKYKQLLAELAESPQKPPRSKLEPHLELIRELRRKGRTYRELSRIFEERLGLSVSPSTLHSFIKVRARHRKRVQFELPPAIANGTLTLDTHETPALPATKNSATKPRFVFRETESLTLSQKRGDR